LLKDVPPDVIVPPAEIVQSYNDIPPSVVYTTPVEPAQRSLLPLKVGAGNACTSILNDAGDAVTHPAALV